MSKIISIGTAVPGFRHEQQSIFDFMQHVFALPEAEKRKLRYMYSLGGIDVRYSVIPDYSRPMKEWKFYPQAENLDPFPSLEQRMSWYQRHAPALSVSATRKCLDGKINQEEITHLITVSCTGMSAPGLDLQLMELLDLPRSTDRTSINFMGCYAAIHAMKIAHQVCNNQPKATVLIVCTELCTLHFQRESSMDNMASSLLFGDGSAALLMTGKEDSHPGIVIEDFYSEVIPKGKKDMAWELSSSGFLMTLSGYLPDLIEEDFESLVNRALKRKNLNKNDINEWCIHPGGRKILEAIEKSLSIQSADLKESYQVLREYGNMSSPTIIFVLQKLLNRYIHGREKGKIFGAAFGPGLTMETFIAST